MSMKALLETTKELLEYERDAKAQAYKKIIHETQCANDWFRLSYERKLKIAELENEIQLLREKVVFAEQAVDKFFKSEDETDLLKIAEWNEDNG